MKLTPVTIWRTRTWPGPGGGSSISSSARTSGPPGFENRMAFMGSAQMLAKEGRGAAIGELGIGAVVMIAAVARKGMVHLGIDVNRDMRIALESVNDFRLRRGRHILVLACDMQHQRFLDVLRLTQHLLDVHAVIAD